MRERIRHFKQMLLFSCFLGMGLTESVAQQETFQLQYMSNPEHINPAYVGTRGVVSFFGSYRNQWEGLEGAPETFSFFASTPLGFKGSGLGLGVNSNKIGALSETSITGDISYEVVLKPGLHFSFGIKTGVFLLSKDLSKLNAHHPGDPLIEEDNIVAPMVGTGGFLYTDRWYIGLSTPNMIEARHFKELKMAQVLERMHLYLMGGYVFDLNPDFKLKPAMLVRAVSGAPLSVDVSLNAQYRERISLGLGYGVNTLLNVMTGFQVKEGILLGFSYAWDTTEISNYSSGTAEIFMRFDLGGVNYRFF